MGVFSSPRPSDMSIQHKGWWNSEPIYISLISQMKLMGRALIFSIRTWSNLSFCATVMVFFQSPIVPEERVSKGKWEAECAPLWSLLQSVTASLGKQFLAHSASPWHWPAKWGSVCSSEDMLPNLGAENKTQHRLMMALHIVTQLIVSGVLLVAFKSRRKLTKSNRLFFSQYTSTFNSWRSPPTLSVRMPSKAQKLRNAMQLVKKVNAHTFKVPLACKVRSRKQRDSLAPDLVQL